MRNITSVYLHSVLDVKFLKDCINQVIKDTKKIAEFDAIAFRGMSGAIVAPSVAMQINKSLLIVRKFCISCHSKFIVEGSVNGNYIIVDDCVDSGETIKKIHRAITEFSPQSKCVGIFLYNQEGRGCVNPTVISMFDNTPFFVSRIYNEKKRQPWDLPRKTTIKSFTIKEK